MLDLAASTSQMGRFETGAMTSTQNLTALADVSGRSAAPAGGPTCVRGMPCTARQGQEEPWHVRKQASDTDQAPMDEKTLPGQVRTGLHSRPEASSARSSGNVRSRLVSGSWRASCSALRASICRHRPAPAPVSHD